MQRIVQQLGIKASLLDALGSREPFPLAPVKVTSRLVSTRLEPVHKRSRYSTHQYGDECAISPVDAAQSDTTSVACSLCVEARREINCVSASAEPLSSQLQNVPELASGTTCIRSRQSCRRRTTCRQTAVKQPGQPGQSSLCTSTTGPETTHMLWSKLAIILMFGLLPRAFGMDDKNWKSLEYARAAFCASNPPVTGCLQRSQKACS